MYPPSAPRCRSSSSSPAIGAEPHTAGKEALPVPVPVLVLVLAVVVVVVVVAEAEAEAEAEAPANAPGSRTQKQE